MMARGVLRSAWAIPVILTALASPIHVAGKTVYVSPLGNDQGNGLTWAAAKKTVPAGLNAAVSSDQVWVAAGTYVGRITLKSGVALYGGFAGNETDLAQRNWVTNVTILDGNKSGSVVTGPSGATASTCIDGFTICNGSGTPLTGSTAGGGIYCSSSSPTIANNTITGNSATFGGGIYCSPSSSSITSNSIIGNSSQTGGGVYCGDGSPSIPGNVITGNTATSVGGGIYCFKSSATIFANAIQNNMAGSTGTGGGGGIYCYASSPTISNNNLKGNVSTLGGGGIHCASSSSPTISNNRVVGNACGAIYCESSSSPTISNNTITGNSAGGGISFNSSSPLIFNNIVAFNSSGIYGSSGSPTLANNCIYNPDGTDYSGATAGSGDFSSDPHLLAVAYGEVHLVTGSPCIDAGLDYPVQPGWVDMDGAARVQGTHVDVGADEFNGTTPSFTPSVVRVGPSGNDSNSGSDWASAKRTVQAAIEMAAGNGGDVWVAAGSYIERVVLRPGVYVYGGFAGMETSRDQRNWLSHFSILDGGAGGSVVTALSGHRISTIDGFTIRNGTGRGDSVLRYGGGFYCSSCSPTISNNRIVANTAGPCGGGIYCLRASPAIAGNVIVGNRADNGGGIWCDTSSPTVLNNVIAGNGANSGGGFYCSFSSSPTVSNNTIAGNYAKDGGGFLCSAGSYAPALPIISNNIIAFNSSGISNSGGAPVLRSNCVYNPDGYNYLNLSPGGGDISTDPQLLAVAYGQFHLKAGSPCMDAGDNNAVQAGWGDIDGQARIQGTRVDIGADEFNGATPVFTPSVVRVSPSGDDANDGSNWTLAKRTVQAGIDAASVAGGEIWVAAEVYTQRIALRPWAYLFGGFAGTESSRDQRDWASNVTVLDGGAGGSVVTASAGYRFMCIDGFTIRNGSITSVGRGGIYCTDSAPTISNNTIVGNNGSGVYCVYSPATVSNNVILSNTGSGVYCFTSKATIGKNMIAGNSSGGIYFSYSSGTISNNTITGNSGGGGAGIYCYSASPSISNNVITGNSPRGISCDYASAPTITNNTVAGNSSGGISTASASPVISNNIVAFNAWGLGSSSGAPTLRNNCVYNPDGYDYSGMSPGSTDIRVDPRLLAAGYGETHLTAGSPCINAGFDSAVQMGWLDIDDQPRIQDTHVDIGADEFNGTLPPPFTPQVVRVSSAGDDGNNGSSWILAKRTVQAGIDSASKTGGEVWVAGGTYNERVSLKSWVYVYGGFAGTESSRDQRNWASNVTVLDGGGAGSVVTAVAGGFRASQFDGFTIRNGVGTLINSFLYGGGIYCGYASPTISNNTITGNRADYGGGISSSSSAVITNTIVIGNTARNGGGIYTDAGTSARCDLINCTFANNTATVGYGGAAYLSAISSVLNCVFWQNTAPTGSTIALSQGALSIAYSDFPPGSSQVYILSGSTVTYGQGNLNVDPLFVFPASGDYHLSSASSCIDAGDPASDYSLEPEPDGGRINMGAYGNTAEAETHGQLYITGYNQVQSTRFGRTVFQYDLTINVRNAAGQTYSNVVAVLKQVPSNVVVVDNTVNVGDVPALGSTTSMDTFTIQVDRSALVSALPISWQISYGNGQAMMTVLLDLGSGAPVEADFNADGHVDEHDLAILRACTSGAAVPYAGSLPAACTLKPDPDGFIAADFDHDDDVDQDDLGVFQRCYAGSASPPACK